MAKNVALSNKAYSILEKMKRSGESFSDVVIRITNNDEKPSWRDSIGTLAGDKEAERIYKKILEDRHKRPKKEGIKW